MGEIAIGVATTILPAKNHTTTKFNLVEAPKHVEEAEQVSAESMHRLLSHFRVPDDPLLLVLAHQRAARPRGEAPAHGADGPGHQPPQSIRVLDQEGH